MGEGGDRVLSMAVRIAVVAAGVLLVLIGVVIAAAALIHVRPTDVSAVGYVLCGLWVMSGGTRLLVLAGQAVIYRTTSRIACRQDAQRAEMTELARQVTELAEQVAAAMEEIRGQQKAAEGVILTAAQMAAAAEDGQVAPLTAGRRR